MFLKVTDIMRKVPVMVRRATKCFYFFFRQTSMLMLRMFYHWVTHSLHDDSPVLRPLPQFVFMSMLFVKVTIIF